MPGKLDYKRELSPLYSAPRNPVEVLVPPLNFLTVSGGGGPDSSEFEHAIEALYAVSYTAKFNLKRANPPVDYAVMPLEGLWWAEDMDAFIQGKRDDWQWTLMVMQPPMLDAAAIDDAKSAAGKKKPLPALDRLAHETIDEGLCAQLMHIGPFAEETPTIERLHAFIGERGHELRGRHHEIYLSDPRRTAPERLRTILRQPMA